MTKSAFDFHVNRSDFHQHRVVEKQVPKENDIDDGQILIKVDQFAFTANNITYAAVGEVVGYWNFFPVSDEWGIIPVWGFGNVVASKHESVKVGERYYGYYPMGSHLVLTPVNVKNGHFTDGARHRAALPPIYNNYIDTASDPGYSPKGEAIQSLFRPLFTTSFLLADFLEDSNFFDARQVLLTSASSKTAIGLAFLLAQNQKNRDVQIIGLTSPGNVEFVNELGYYDRVLTYDDVSDKVSAEDDAVIVDFSGNADLQETLQKLFGDMLKYNCLVGMVDWTQRGGPDSAANKGKFFFAPSQYVKRNKEWGPAVLQQKLGAAWMAFTTQTGSWLDVQVAEGVEGLKALYLPMLDGKIDPRVGRIVKW